MTEEGLLCRSVFFLQEGPKSIYLVELKGTLFALQGYLAI